MSELRERLVRDRAMRDAARDTFDTRFGRLRRDLDDRGIGRRIADDIGNRALDGIDQAIEVADESRSIVAGTAAVLALWFLRRPIIRWIEGRFAGGSGENEANGASD